MARTNASMSGVELRKSRRNDEIRKKLNCRKAVAPITGIPLAIFFWAFPPTIASSQNHPHPSVSTTGNQSPAIGSSGRDVIINYNATVKGTGHELQRGTFLLDSPNLDNLSGPQASKRIVCSALAGTPVLPTGKREDYGPIKDYWWEVAINTGNCAGKRGWVVWNSLK
jgi:hypothetical protein